MDHPMDIPIVGQREDVIILKLVYNPTMQREEIFVLTDGFHAGLPKAVLVLSKTLELLLPQAFQEIFQQNQPKN
jgi:hypothetical protein